MSRLQAVLLAQGDEITTGQTVDTNSGWIARHLTERGFVVRQILAAPDIIEDLTRIVAEAGRLADVVICTGGLGPTRDDLTAEAVAVAVGQPLELNPVANSQVEATFARWGRVVSEANRKQAVLPRGCEVLENAWGTAPGFALQVGGARLYCLPGVPSEMKAMLLHRVLPDLDARYALEPEHPRTIRVIGVPESVLEEQLQGLEAELPGRLRVGFRTAPSENQVKLRFAAGVSPADQQRVLDEARARIGHRAFGVDCGDLAEVTGGLLAASGHTLALAESCTAGKLAAWIARTPGASRYLMEGAVVYSNAAKVRAVGVPEALIAEHGAVSMEVARALAEGMRARAQTTWGVGITGVAGPGGGSPEKPVGTVHIAVAGPSGTTHRVVQLPGDRERVTELAAASALYLLYRAVGAFVGSGGEGQFTTKG